MFYGVAAEASQQTGHTRVCSHMRPLSRQWFKHVCCTETQLAVCGTQVSGEPGAVAATRNCSLPASSLVARRLRNCEVLSAPNGLRLPSSRDIFSMGSYLEFGLHCWPRIWLDFWIVSKIFPIWFASCQQLYKHCADCCEGKQWAPQTARQLFRRTGRDVRFCFGTHWHSLC